MARNITFMASALGLPDVKIEMTGFNDGVIDQYENQTVVAGLSNVLVSGNETSASVSVNGNVILNITDLSYCEVNNTTMTAFTDLPNQYFSII